MGHEGLERNGNQVFIWAWDIAGTDQLWPLRLLRADGI